MLAWVHEDSIAGDSSGGHVTVPSACHSKLRNRFVALSLTDFSARLKYAP